MCTEADTRRPGRQRGASLIEVVVFIVVVSVAAAAVLGSLQFSARASTDPLLRMQALAIAEATMEELLARPVSGIREPSNHPARSLQDYSIAVSVSSATLADEQGSAAPALRIRVTVTGPAETVVVLESFRTGHADHARD